MGSGAQSAFVASMYPSGESLKTAEAPFSAKITDRQISTGDVWEDLIIFAAQISDIEVPENVEVNTIWIPATPKSNVEELDNAKKKMDLGIPVEVIWAELGYTPQEVTAMLQARNKAIQEEQTRVKELAAANTAPVQGEDS
jgi:hypothetical protein